MENRYANVNEIKTCAGLNPQQLIAVGLLMAMGMIGARTDGQRHRAFRAKT